VKSLLSLLVVILGGAVLASCAPSAAPSPRAATGNAVDSPRRPMPPLVFIARGEPENLNEGYAVGTSSSTTFRFFNATLALRDGQGVPGPQLAAALPKRNTDSWRVFPDGRMETTYRLKPNLAWHDGQPLRAEDYVFGWRVLKQPELGTSGDLPQSLMERVDAPDPLTVVVQWSAPFAGAEEAEGFNPLPRHILEAGFTDLRPDVWVSQSYWTREYVGTGAFKIDNWEPGAAIEGSAFEGYVFGRPKLDRLRIIFMQDTNTVAANLLSGAAHLVADITIRSQTGALLKREWAGRNGGTVTFTPAQIRYTFFQLRQDYASHRELQDLRVRRAVAHSIDRQLLADALHEGEGIAADAIVRRGTPEYASVERVATKYAYDPRQSQVLLDEAGLTRGGDGFYVAGSGTRFNPEWKATAGGDTDIQLGLLVDSLRRIGVDAHQAVLPRPFSNETRVTFPGMMNWSTTNQPEGWLLNYTTQRIAAPENRWTGSNFGGWSHPEYDRLAATFATTLERNQRSELMVQLARVLSEQVPVLPLYYNLDVVAHTAAVHNVRVVPDGSIGFNVHEWELIERS
jgi:peptide/nickel transport system substrate-binding protein